MTAREVYEAVLVEVNKENAPSFTVEEFNYMINKSVLALVNEKYNFYSANQQLSDDLRVLLKKATFNVDISGEASGVITPTYNPIRCYLMNEAVAGTSDLDVSLLVDLEVSDKVKFDGVDGTIYTIQSIDDGGYPYELNLNTALGSTKQIGQTLLKETASITGSESESEDRIVSAILPSSDYLHALSCRVYWKGNKPGSSKEAHLVFPAKRLTYDMLNAIENNTYLRPAANRPYFKVHDNQMNSGIARLAGDASAYKAYQNKPKIDIHIGRHRTSMSPVKVEIDYLKLPEVIALDDIDIFTAGVDTSQTLELPDYLKNEVVRRISAYLLEKTRDPRIQTQPQLNQEIPSVPINMQMQQQAAQGQGGQNNQ